jgi:restriction endonuclease
MSCAIRISCFARFFRENKKLNIKLESVFFLSKIASLRSVHDDMSAKLCDNYKMIVQG